MPAALFIFAHPDDEYGVAATIASEIRKGTTVLCRYLTNGAAGGVQPDVRARESRRALASLGVSADNIKFVGWDRNIPDGQLHRNLSVAFDAVEQSVQPEAATINIIYAMAWEGGHADHDAAHLVALALAKKLRLPPAALYQYPSYRALKHIPALFRVMSPLCENGEVTAESFGFVEGLRLATLCRYYPSQFRSWLGLFPECFIKYAILRRQVLQPVTEGRAFARPHNGRLFYETRFGISWEQFDSAVSEFKWQRCR